MTSKAELEHVHGAFLIAAAVAITVAVAALLGRVGADARWLAALGHTITAHGSVPSGIPFAAASSAHWPNALVLAELIFNALERAFGDRGLMLAQLVAVAAAMGVLARDARRAGAEPVSSARVLLICALGALPALVIARVQLFSLILFPVLLALLRAQARAPSRRIWLVVALLALWSNLHGAALLGLGTVLVFLLFGEGRAFPLRSIGVALASVLSLCATPALLGTVSYYHGLLSNLAAQRGQGMWGPLSLTSPLQVVMAACVIALLWRVRRRHLPRWELVLVVLLAPLTIQAQRNGVWLLFLLVTPAALAAGERVRGGAVWQRLVTAGVPIALAAVVFSIARGPLPAGASSRLIAAAIARADGSPVLAAQGLDEQVALAGGRIWMGDPIDAFSHPDQAAYLDWMSGSAQGARLLTPSIQVVLVQRRSASAKLMAAASAFEVAGADLNSVLYERRSDPQRLAR